MRKKAFLHLLAFFITTLIITVFVEKLFNISFDGIQNFVASFGIFGPIVYVALLFSGLAVPFNPIPDLLIVNAAAFLFPPYQSVIATFIAHTLTLIVDYHLARKYGEGIVKKFTSKEETAYVEKIAKDITPIGLFGLRFILPLATATGLDILSYIAGLEKMNFGKFFMASIIPWTILSVIFFYSTAYFRSQSTFLYFLPGILLVLIPLAIFEFKRRRTKTE